MNLTPEEEQHRRRSCVSKQRYDTFELAKMAIPDGKGRKGKVMTAYHCRYCRKYHWGNTDAQQLLFGTIIPKPRRDPKPRRALQPKSGKPNAFAIAARERTKIPRTKSRKTFDHTLWEDIGDAALGEHMDDPYCFGDQ